MGGRLEALCERIARSWVEVRRRTVAFLRGLLAGVERKNSWQLAEQAGAATQMGCNDCSTTPAGTPTRSAMIYAATCGAPRRPRRGAGGGRDGFLKKGTKSAGVQRRYSGTAGRIENCQVGVFLAYASRHGHALIDRELYLPELAQRSGALPGGCHPRCGRLLHQAAAGSGHAGAGAGGRDPGRLGDRRRGHRRTTAPLVGGARPAPRAGGQAQRGAVVDGPAPRACRQACWAGAG